MTVTVAQLENLVRIGQLRREAPVADELAGLKRSAQSRLADATRPDLSFARFLRGEIVGVFDHPVYADGSFVTDKISPNDVDVVLELLDAGDAQKWQGFMFMQEHQVRIRHEYGVDFWVNLPGGNNFATFFQYAGHKTAKFKGLDHKHPKGILRIG